MRRFLLIGMFIAVLTSFACVLMATQVDSAATLYTFSMTSNQYVRNPTAYEWSGYETYTVTFDITIDADYYYQDLVDVYFVDTYNFNLYYDDSTFTFIWRVVGLGEGSWSYDLEGFEPDPSLDYWLVIDDTSSYDTAAVPDVSGSFEVIWVQTSGVEYTFDGYVYDADTDEGIGYARVSIDSGTYIAYTDSVGHFIFSAVSPGTYSVLVTASGYTEYSFVSLTISGDATTNFYLEPMEEEKDGISGVVLVIVGGIAAIAVVVIVVILALRKRKSEAPAPGAAPFGIPPAQEVSTASSAAAAPQVQWSPSPPPPAPSPARQFCTNCGAPLLGDVKSCDHCGSPVDNYGSTELDNEHGK